jgi:uncharacterized small protein (DUF1192 family)
MNGHTPSREELLDFVQEQQRRIEALTAEVARRRAELDEAGPSAKRHAALFRRAARKRDPKPPGRMPGDCHGCRAHRPPPVDEVHDAPLPDACPHCRGQLLMRSPCKQQGSAPSLDPSFCIGATSFEDRTNCEIREQHPIMQHSMTTDDSLHVAMLGTVHRRVFVVFLGVCLAWLQGCSSKQDDYYGEIFSREKPDLDACSRLVQANGGKIPTGKEWKALADRLLHSKPMIIPTESEKTVLFEIINQPLDANAVFVFVPRGTDVDEFLRKNPSIPKNHSRRELRDGWHLVKW